MSSIDVVKVAKSQLSDAENVVVMAELKKLYERLGSYRAVGQALKFPKESASQTIRAALVDRNRAGREIADRLYTHHLKTTRERFLMENGVAVEPVAVTPEPTVERVQNHDAADMDALERVILGTQPWWPSGTTPEQIERVSTIARDERFKVKDPSVLSETFWFGRLEEIARDVTGCTKSVHKREAVEDPVEQDARELAEERARRKDAREARAKGSQ